jgi:hypothetical protein
MGILANMCCSMISYPNYKFIFPIKALGMYAKRFGDEELLEVGVKGGEGGFAAAIPLILERERNMLQPTNDYDILMLMGITEYRSRP